VALALLVKWEVAVFRVHEPFVPTDRWPVAAVVLVAPWPAGWPQSWLEAV
jgi:hypothetical protein